MTKPFPLHAVLTLATGFVWGPFGDAHELAEHLMGYPVWTHEFVSLHDELSRRANALHPEFASIPKSAYPTSPEDCAAKLAAQEARFGSTIDVPGGRDERTDRGEIVTPTKCPGGGQLPTQTVLDFGDTIGATAPPARYNRDGERECIDLMRDLLGDEGFVAYCLGQVLKYTYRAGAKDLAEQDIEKARFYQRMALHVLDPATNEDPRSYRASHQAYQPQPFDMAGRHELLQHSVPDLDDSVPYWHGHSDYTEGVPRSDVPSDLNTLGKTMWLRGWDAAKKKDDEEPEVDTEAAMQAGMAHGTQGYNEARGWDTTEPEPCGHHCDSSCPRCGGE